MGTMGTMGTAPLSTQAVAQVQVCPYEALLDTGETQEFSVKLFDAKGNLVREAAPSDVQWAVEGLAGTVSAAGVYQAPDAGSAGTVQATVGGVTGQPRARVIPPLPWTYDFNSAEGSMPWWNANLKVTVTDREGEKVLIRAQDGTVGRRAKVIMGRPEWSNYTVEADVLGTEARRQRGDPGLINQRYMMVLFGNPQELELHPWQAADEMSVTVPFTWETDVWYHMKLRVEPRADGTTLMQGKVWQRDQPEPAEWTIEKVDTIGHTEGAPGLYGDGYSDIFYDNFRVYPNR